MTYTTELLSELFSKKNKNIYCFGAGRVFDSFVEEFADYDLKDKIKAIVDNNPDVVKALAKEVNGFSIPLISFEKMIQDIKSSDKILITTDAYEEIIGQLESVKTICDVSYSIYPILRMEQYDYERLKMKMPSQLSFNKKLQIPKTIHYCWFGGKEIPIPYGKWMESWRTYCPDYEIIEWNEKNYDVHKSRYISQAYKMKQWAFVSDYARIDIIHQYGGVYLDVDVELIKNIDEMLMNQAFCGFENSMYVNYGLGFGAKKDNFILREIKEYYDGTPFIQENGMLDLTRCPFIQTNIMKRHGLKCDGSFQMIEGMAVYPSRILCGMSPYSFRIERNPEHTYAIHHFAGSWIEDKQEKSALISAMKKWSRNDNYIYTDL